jgi:crotonobetainyl-CoA:carnitine CoA-transferase CaiB-like acyl-CoA transferase
MPIENIRIFAHMRSTNKALKDLKVVELASVLAGPGVGVFFAELGAEVIKIENKRTGGDVTRSWKLPSEDKHSKESAYFLSVNFFKKHLFLDLSDAYDYGECLAHIRGADVVIVNYKKGDDRRLKLDYRRLQKINPRLIYAAISGFSEADERVAYDLVLQAESGFMSMNGTAASGPLKMPVALIDILAAHHLKEAILLALLQREKTGKGSHVSVSLFDAAVASLANQASNWLVAKQLPKRTGSLHPNIAPYGEIFGTKDKRAVTFAIGSDRQFSDLCVLLKLPQLPGDKKFATNQQRVKNRTSLYKLMAARVKLHTAAGLQKKCTRLMIPFARVRNLAEVFELAAAKKLVVSAGRGPQAVRTAIFKSTLS